MTMNNDDTAHVTQNGLHGTRVGRMVAALHDPDRLYESGHVAYLMAAAMRWGYELATETLVADPMSWQAGYDAGRRDAEAETNIGYPPPPYLIAQGIRIRGDQAAARAAAATDRTQRYAGGPVAVWEADRPDHVPPRDVSVKVVRTGSGYAWRNA
jgi:hypothetical protein